MACICLGFDFNPLNSKRNISTEEKEKKNEACITRENSNFLKNGKMVISVKTQNFSRSRMTKWISPLELSREI